MTSPLLHNRICESIVYHLYFSLLIHIYVPQPKSQVAQQCCSEVCNTGVPFVFASDTPHRRWQSGVMELLQCQQWQERHLFEARCRMIDDDVQGRDALIANMNKLDLRPFWRPVILNTPDTCTGSPPDPPAEDPPAKDPPKGYTRTGTPLPDEDENNLEDAWNPRARNVDADGWEVDADGWTIGRKIEKKTYSAYFAVSTCLDSLDS